MQRFCLALDLVEDAALIAQYEDWHRPGRTPLGVIASIRAAGIAEMQIWRSGTRLFMLIEAEDHFSEEAKARADAANPVVQDWIARMRPLQRPVPSADPDASWIPAAEVFRLTDHPGGA
jgi:L-rhamnose mutarotase